MNPITTVSRKCATAAIVLLMALLASVPNVAAIGYGPTPKCPAKNCTSIGNVCEKANCGAGYTCVVSQSGRAAICQLANRNSCAASPLAYSASSSSSTSSDQTPSGTVSGTTFVTSSMMSTSVLSQSASSSSCSTMQDSGIVSGTSFSAAYTVPASSSASESGMVSGTSVMSSTSSSEIPAYSMPSSSISSESGTVSGTSFSAAYTIPASSSASMSGIVSGTSAISSTEIPAYSMPASSSDSGSVSGTSFIPTSTASSSEVLSTSTSIEMTSSSRDSTPATTMSAGYPLWKRALANAMNNTVHSNGTKITAKKSNTANKKTKQQHKLTCDSACDIIVRIEQCDGTYTMKRIPTINGTAVAGKQVKGRALRNLKLS